MSTRKIIAIATAVTAAAIMGLAGQTGTQPTHDAVAGKPSLVASASDLKGSLVAGALAESHLAGKSLLWCSTFQIAWNELAGTMGAPLRVQDDPPLARRLNAAKETRADLDDGSFVAIAGYGRDGIIESIKKQLAGKFGGAASPRLLPASVPPGMILAYAYLFKNLAFEKPFLRAEHPLNFGDGRLHAFGLWPDHRKHDRTAIARQIAVHHYASPTDWTVELATKNPDDRLVIARLVPGQTLADTVAQVLASLDGPDRPNFDHADRLEVPLMNFDITREFTELTGRSISGANASGEIARATQNIRFRLDETGAVLKSEAVIGVTSAAVPQRSKVMVCDGPFAVVMLRRGAAQPYFAAWIENPELLMAWK